MGTVPPHPGSPSCFFSKGQDYRSTWGIIGKKMQPHYNRVRSSRTPVGGGVWAGRLSWATGLTRLPLWPTGGSSTGLSCLQERSRWEELWDLWQVGLIQDFRNVFNSMLEKKCHLTPTRMVTKKQTKKNHKITNIGEDMEKLNSCALLVWV